MKTFELTLTRFAFPKNLDDENANFRFVVDLRYIDDDNESDVKSTVMPSPDGFWECDTGRSDEANYVRGDDNDEHAQFDMDRVGEWDQHIDRINGKGLHAIHFTVFDVDRVGIWEKLEKLPTGIVDAAVGKVKGYIPDVFPVSLPLRGAADDVQRLIQRKIAGGDKVLFEGSRNFKADDPNDLCVSGEGKEGTYEIGFSVRETDHNT